jgi:magnesium-transporting ATPase (P-type)
MQDFFALFFEFFGTVKSAPADDLYEFVYIPAGFIWIFATLLWVVLFYQGFITWRKKARFDTRLHWLIWMLFSSVLTTLAIWILTNSRLQSEDKLYGVDEYLEFLCMAFLWSAILYFVLSIPIKFSNSSRRKIPF